jgi:hypothetical protein
MEGWRICPRQNLAQVDAVIQANARKPTEFGGRRKSGIILRRRNWQHRRWKRVEEKARWRLKEPNLSSAN